MSRYTNDPYRRRRATVQGTQKITLDDYRALHESYLKLRAEYERQGKELAAAEQQLQIKNEIVQRQTEDIKKLDTELIFARAVLQQSEEQADQESTASGEVDWAEQYARLQAELENLRKRWEQRLSTETAQARHRILLDMLPLADHLEMALNHAHSQEAESDVGFIDSIRATQRAFLETLRRYNVTPLEAKGQPFDPSLHEAIGQIASEDVPEGDIVEVIQTGYQEGDKLLRPARVMVSTGNPT